MRYLICEKPIATSLDEARTILEMVDRAGAVVAVPYLRRWSPGTAALAAAIRGGELGAMRAGCVIYTGGLLNNGSHAIDLLHGFFGPVTATAECTALSATVNPTVHCTLELLHDGKAFPVRMIGIDSCEFTMFEIDLIGSRGRAQLRDRGDRIDLSAVGPESNLPRSTVPASHAHLAW